MQKAQTFVLAAFWCSSLASLNIQAASVVASADQKITIDIANTPMPVLSGGSFIVVTSQGTATPSLLLIDHSGSQRSIFIDVPGARTVWLWGYAQGSDGTVAASGQAFEVDGRRSRFVAIFPPHGIEPQLIRTGQYGALRVAVTSDGMVWTAGIEALDTKPSGSTSLSTVIAPYGTSAVIRRFDDKGNLAGSFVPQASLLDFTHLLPGNGTFLTARGNTVVWYSTQEGRYLEISASGISLDLRSIQAPAGSPTQISGFVVTASGRAYLASADSAGHTVLSNLDKTHGSWVPVVMNDSSFRGLYGAQSETLAAMTSDRFTIRFYTISD